MDQDLSAIQEARDKVAAAKKAQAQLAELDQGHVDRIVARMAKAGEQAAEKLAKMAVEETAMGLAKDKTVKNLVATKILHDFIKDMKTVGIINVDEKKKIYEIAVPVGVVAALTPTTNPTSTVMYKSIIAMKARCAIVLSPHPRSKNCSIEAANILTEAAKSAGAPDGSISCLTSGRMEGSDALMKHQDVSVILATGGTAMVRAAYSCGKPAYGVGPGNVPAFIERTADIDKAVRDIIASKTFDNGVICASEQAIVTENVIRNRVLDTLRHYGVYIMNEEEIARLGYVVQKPDGSLNPNIVGQSVQTLAEMAKIPAPRDAKILLGELDGVGKDYPLSREKLSPILAFYSEKDWEGACLRCIEILKYGGIGHTLSIHSNNNDIITEFALKKPVSRIIANSPSTHGATGLTTGLPPAMTLGCGAIGGTITTDNVTPMHMVNIKRLAYEINPVHKPGPETVSGPMVVDEEIIRRVVRRLLKERSK